MYSKNSKFNKRVGTRAQVMHGNAKMTGGGLMKKDLKYNKSGKIVSKKLSRIATKEQRLQKAGYKTQKGVFELFQKQRGGDSDSEEENESKAPDSRVAPLRAAKLQPNKVLVNRFRKTFITVINRYLYDILNGKFSDHEIIKIAQILLSKYNNTPILAYQFIINKIRGKELNNNINNDYISDRVNVIPSPDYNSTIKIQNLFSNIKEGRLVELQLLRDQKAMVQPAPRAAPGGSAAAMAVSNPDRVALLQQATNYGINTNGLTNIQIKKLILSMQNININGMTNKDINNKFLEIKKIHNQVRKNTTKWSCKRCTYKNPSSSKACNICGQPKN